VVVRVVAVWVAAVRFVVVVELRRVMTQLGVRRCSECLGVGERMGYRKVTSQCLNHER
jgi:hypothetical protein